MDRRDLMKGLSLIPLLGLPDVTAAQSGAPVSVADKGGAALPALVLLNAAARTVQDLSGPWRASIDPYQTGIYDGMGDPAPPRFQRYNELDFEAEADKNPYVLYEMDMRLAPTVQLPAAWNAQKPEWRYYDGLMWYQRTFEAKPEAGRRAFLYLEAVNYRAHVYLNGKKLGEHEGGFTPFAFEITDILRPGENRLTVGADATHTKETVPPVTTDWDIYGGITRTVRYVTTPQTFVDDAFIRYQDGQIKASVRLNGKAASGEPVTLTIDGLKLKATATSAADGRAEVLVKAPRGLKLWSPEVPTLYDVRIEAAGDVFTDRVGFRTIEVRGEDIILNGKPIFLRGVCLHEEEIGPNPARTITPASAMALLSEAKHGLNCNYVRLSHYPHNEITVRMADEIGLLVWSEIPLYWAANFKSAQTLKLSQTMLTENILRDRNRASVIIWSVANETLVSDARNAFLKALADTARSLDDTRLVSAALLCERKMVDGRIDMSIDDPIIPVFDIMAVNTYNGWYGNNTLDQLKSTHWHAIAKKPLVFSEFGADALAGYYDPGHMRKYSEDFQAEYYRKTLEMADNIPFLKGLSPWILKDFQALRRQHPVFQNGWNRKGLISEIGERKQAFNVMADYFKAKAQAGG